VRAARHIGRMISAFPGWFQWCFRWERTAL
jgi:hypothetical protein